MTLGIKYLKTISISVDSGVVAVYAFYYYMKGVINTSDTGAVLTAQNK